VAAIALVGIVLVLLACLVLAIYVALSSNNSPEAQPTSLRPTITDSGDREIVSPFPIGDIPKTGNGEWVVYSTHQGDGHQSIQLVNIETSERRPLLLNQDMNLAGAAWSPDGERIAFYAYDETEQGDIYLMDADGDNFVNLTESPNYDDREPAWSPDGQQLVFHSNRPDQNGTGTQDYELYILDVNTLALKQITNNTVNDLAPDWSADGKYLVFYRYDGNQAAIYTMNIENNLFSQRRQISPDTLSNALYPTWSPDGQLVAFHVLDNDGNYQIYVMNADGTATRPLLEEYFNDKYPDWSPDGRYIIFQREIDGVTGIFVYSFITRQIEQVAVPNGDFQPDWQPHPIP
jgi:TolB protein